MWLGVKMDRGTEADASQSKLEKPFAIVPVQTHTAAEAYQMVLKNAGAVLPARDTLDSRIIDNVKNRTGRSVDVQGGYLHGTPYELTVSAWPALTSAPPQKDSDKDGMPDEWELSHRLNPLDSSDATSFVLHRSYTNIEVFINELVKHLNKIIS